jgi:hypothetical protein
MKRIKTKNIKWCEKELKFREGVKTGIEMSFLSPDDTQCSMFFHCRDFLQDTILSYIHSIRKEIYGFSYDPTIDPPLSLSETKILFANSKDHSLADKVLPCLEFINQFEKEAKIPKTRIFYCKNPPNKYLRCGVWLFKGHYRWMNSPPMISLYSLLIRVGLNHNLGDNYWKTIDSIIDEQIEPIQSMDKFRLRESKFGIKKIIEIGDKNIFHKEIKDNYPVNLKLKDVHNKLGIVAFSKGISKEFVPHWYRNIK